MPCMQPLSFHAGLRPVGVKLALERSIRAQSIISSSSGVPDRNGKEGTDSCSGFVGGGCGCCCGVGSRGGGGVAGMVASDSDGVEATRFLGTDGDYRMESEGRSGAVVKRRWVAV